jgi:uncharacterized protein
MTHYYADILFTPTIKALQTQQGSRAAYAQFEQATPRQPDRIGPAEKMFIDLRDSFYLASVTQTGWPYVQHRGGPPGFLKVLDAATLGFADFRGNRQYVSLGNIADDTRVSLFLMDYAGRRRLKIIGHAETSDAPAQIARVTMAGYPARVERAFLIRVMAFDWNCPQHILPRYSEPEIAENLRPVEATIAALRAENQQLKAELDGLRKSD